MAYQSQEVEEKTPKKNLPKVLILKPPNVFKILEKHFYRKFEFLRPWESPLPTDQFLSIHAASIQAMFCNSDTRVTVDLLRRLPSLGFIFTNSAGVNHIDLPECRRSGISIANAPEIFSKDVADMAVALLIDVLRKISVGDRFVHRGLWPTRGEFPLDSKTGGGTLPITTRTLETIIRLSTAHAKLKLSIQVLKSDVEAALKVLNFAIHHKELTEMEEGEQEREFKSKRRANHDAGKNNRDGHQGGGNDTADYGSASAGRGFFLWLGCFKMMLT